MNVRDIMSQDVACCTAETPLQEVAQMMIDRDCGAIPVVDDIDNRRLLGVVTDRDIVTRVVAQGYDANDKTASDCMSTPVFTLPLDASLEEAEATLQEHQVRRLPVIDSSNGACCGMLAQADIARYAPSGETAETVKRVSQPAPTIDQRVRVEPSSGGDVDIR
jgi:CBS domain-containing protein